MSEITKTERTELAGVVKRNYKVARRAIDVRKAELLANFEAMMAKEWQPYEMAKKESLEAIDAAITEVNRQIAKTFAERRIPARFAPRAGSGWVERGENLAAARRAELRKVAVSQLDASAEQARFKLDRAEAEQLTQLASSAITSDEARAFLGQIPGLEMLMPAINVEMLMLASGEEDDAAIADDEDDLA